MPKQDISKEFCKFLKDDISEKRFDNFLKERNEKALDIGICYTNKSDNIVIKIFKYKHHIIIKY